MRVSGPTLSLLPYPSPGSRIAISTRRNGDYVLVSIMDQGVGMTEGQVARAFDTFYRADHSNTAIDGLGMGMSIVQNIIRAHDGTIDITSVPGTGTTVTFGLPLSSTVSLQ
jgi:signal transduction histidine kinase